MLVMADTRYSAVFLIYLALPFRDMPLCC